MKNILATLIMLIIWNISEAQVVESVAGLKFGTDKQTAIKQLTNRFGYNYTNEGDYISFYNVSIGGIDYDFADFGFVNSKFIFARFSSYFDIDKSSDARNKQYMINKTYSSKYGAPYVGQLNDGVTYDCYGKSMWPNDHYFPINIGYNKVITNSGKQVISVYIYYYIYMYDDNNDI